MVGLQVVYLKPVVGLWAVRLCLQGDQYPERQRLAHHANVRARKTRLFPEVAHLEAVDWLTL